MNRVTLKELNMNSRQEVISFLKKLWSEEEVDCPFCGEKLELLHKKAKKDNSDWQCKRCNKTFKALYLLDELNDKL
ncbi:MAG: transposase [Clostridia bacterium]|nr:transposase [Clostridia bacterium]